MNNDLTKMSLPVVAVIAIVIQSSALVWWASSMNSNVEQLTNDVTAINSRYDIEANVNTKRDIEDLKRDLADLDETIEELEETIEFMEMDLDQLFE